MCFLKKASLSSVTHDELTRIPSCNCSWIGRYASHCTPCSFTVSSYNACTIHGQATLQIEYQLNVQSVDVSNIDTWPITRPKSAAYLINQPNNNQRASQVPKERQHPIAEHLPEVCASLKEGSWHVSSIRRVQFTCRKAVNVRPLQCPHSADANSGELTIT